MSPASTRVAVDVGGRPLTLSNLGKVLYPQAGFTKAQVLDYYTRVAPVLLPHLAGRPLTLKRYPDGVDGGFFYEKNAPSHRPGWVRTARIATPGSTRQRETIDFVVVDQLATLVWVANLGSLELHTPMWRVGPAGGGGAVGPAGGGGAAGPDLLVLDLDPGPPATVVDCCRVALLLRPLLDALGLDAVAKTSGSKGLQLYARMPMATTSEATSALARELAERLEREQPALVVSRMQKALRPGKVLVDWSQNNAAKTTVSVYSLRARPRPTVSTPVSWDEVADCADENGELVFTAPDVLDRVAADGDLFAPLLG